MVKQVANLMRQNLRRNQTSPSSPLVPLGRNSVFKLKKRHSEIQKSLEHASRPVSL